MSDPALAQDEAWPGTPVSSAPVSDPAPAWPGTPVEQAKPGLVEDVAKTVPSALARGTAGVIGIPGMVSDGTDWLFSKITGRSPEQLASERAAQQSASSDRFGFNIPSAGEVMTPEKVTKVIEGATGPLYHPQTTPGRYVGAVAEAAPGMILGGGTAWERALSTVGAGIGSESGADLFKGTWFEPYARVVGSLIGGVTGGMAPTAVDRSFAGVKNAGQKAAAPFTETGQQRIAGQQIENAADNPVALRAALEDPATMYPGAKPGEIVPGSAPTTFQRTGDAGIGQLERKVATQSPQDFLTRRAEQNAARVDALEGVQPAGSPADVSSLLRSQLQHVDDASQAIVDRVAAHSRTAADGISPVVAADDVGEGMRAALAARNAELKAHERRLWNAVDPDNSLTLNVDPLRAAAQSVESRVSSSARPIAGEERAILDVVNSYPQVLPFNELTDLRSRISTAMREERRAVGEGPVLARLTQLRGALENTIDTAVQRRVAQEADAVASGAMRAEDTIAENLRRWQNEWRSSRAAATGTGDGAGATGYAGSGASPLSGVGRAEGEAGIGSGGAARDQGVSGQPTATLLDEAAAERLRAASAATRERKGTFNQGPVGETLRTNGMAGDFKSLDGAVPGKFFRPGPEGGERVGLYREAAGNPAQADQALTLAAAASLRSKALRPDGTIDPAAFQSWQRAHGPALDAVPGLRDRFSTAARAAEALEFATVQRRQALEAMQVGAVGKLIGVSDPQDVVKTIGGIFGTKNAVQEMRALAQRASATPEGTAGLRKAIAEHIRTQLVSNAEAGTSGVNLISANAFQNFVKRNGATLRQAFTPEEVGLMGAIAQDIVRANRSVVSTKLPGGSNSPQDLSAMVGKHGILGRIMESAKGAGPWTGAAIGMTTMGPKGLILGAGAGLYGKLKAAGMAKVDDLVKEALLNPELARTLLKAAPPKMDRGPWLQLGRQLDRLAVFGAEGAAAGREDRRPRKSGGRVDPTDAQKEAGNYQMHHATFQGLPISIETKRAQERSGVDANGKAWSVKMPADYGYIKRTEGADGDHVDAYVGPIKDAPLAWIIDQIDPETRKFDEHKIMLGFRNRGHAEQTYRAGFSDRKGGKRLGAITTMDIKTLKSWLASEGTAKPVSYVS